MWSALSLVAILSIVEGAISQDANEAAQNQTSNDTAGTAGVVFFRNLTASISVSDADLIATTSEPFKNSSNRGLEELRTAEAENTAPNLIQFNAHTKLKSALMANTSTNNFIKSKFDDFHPSPQLKIEYEHNKFPVKLAHPEAKTIPNYGKISFDDQSFRSRGGPDVEDDSEASLKQRQTEDNTLPWTTRNYDNSWTNKVRFPPSQQPNDEIQPYQFEANKAPNPPNCCQGNTLIVGSQYSVGPVSSKFSRPHAVNNPRSGYFPSAISSHSSSGEGNRFPIGYASSAAETGRDFNFNKLIQVPKKYYPYDDGIPIYEKTYETPFNIMEKPYDVRQHSHGGGRGASSWKKILKVLATFIPIGLLISALTPTVITVTNVNDTSNTQQTRYRSNDDPKRELHSQILSSLDYFDKLNENGCEHRVFCELLVTASQMPDSSRHVQNLLDNFANQDVDYKSRAEDLKKVFEAVRNQDCNPISCSNLDNT
ncbi:uncharacterized protein [Euwallacea similis]|uniref:uncharacterized protein n=1 Tax=Euwallacea similis TaxID=1736056 RepID=UPI00345035B4